MIFVVVQYNTCASRFRMISRITMAEALIARAKSRRSEIGDHGDPYEEALLTGHVSIELRLIVKEIFDHLRSALDYVAREVCERCLSINDGKQFYFPITSKSFSQENFRSRLGKLMPGLIESRPDLIPTFESFQPFFSSNNNWISDFATLCNESKHEQLSTVYRSQGLGESQLDASGEFSWVTYRDKEGKRPAFRKMPLVLITSRSENGTGNFTFCYVEFTETGEELLGFLDVCIDGIQNIIETLKAHL